jgi:hypothetical protein
MLHKISKKWSITVVVLLLIAGTVTVGVCLWNYYGLGWNTFRDEQHGFSFRYPPEKELELPDLAPPAAQATHFIRISSESIVDITANSGTDGNNRYGLKEFLFTPIDSDNAAGARNTYELMQYGASVSGYAISSTTISGIPAIKMTPDCSRQDEQYFDSQTKYLTVKDNISYNFTATDSCGSPEGVELLKKIIRTVHID